MVQTRSSISCLTLGDTADAYDDYEDGPSCMGGGGQLQSEERSDEYRESNFEVVLQDNGMFCAKLRVAAAFYPFLIGKKGATKKRLENETRAKVTIPRQVNTTNKLLFFQKSWGMGVETDICLFKNYTEG